MKTDKFEKLWVTRVKVCFNILFTRLLRILYEIVMLVLLILLFIPMLLSNKFFKPRAILFMKELSDFGKDKNK